jgi:hypothetical protein
MPNRKLRQKPLNNGEKMDYEDFIRSKMHTGADSGFDPVFMPDFLFDYQKSLIEWAVRKGRAALYADCGLGKTPMGLVYASNVARKANKPVLYLTPLAVGMQTIREAEKFGIQARLCRDGVILPGDHIVVTNYERLHYFNPNDFAGVVCDESSCIKNFSGVRSGEISSFMRKVPYRLLQTATAAPNEYIELGTSSEALGYMGHMDMLNRFFKNDLNNSATGRMRGEVIKWRLKGHAEDHFWRWVCSWARAIRRPSDIGFEDGRHVLPALREVEHLVEVNSLADGFLFALPAVGLKEQREEIRRTINERCEKAASLVNHTGQPAVCWANLNDEGDLLEKLIPDAVQVSGKDSDDAKEEKLMAFADGKARALITKQKIAGWGMNWQHCNHMTEFPTHSYEGYYQKVRRFWRFGQSRDVTVDIVTTEGERGIMKNMQRKADQADKMFSRLVAEMNNAMAIDRKNEYNKPVQLPAWL